uniref:Uncharacterized protein n=1 Tax=Tetranychus urticae TaxID=32264 RepID=T1KDK1_TETUR
MFAVKLKMIEEALIGMSKQLKLHLNRNPYSFKLFGNMQQILQHMGNHN